MKIQRDSKLDKFLLPILLLTLLNQQAAAATPCGLPGKVTDPLFPKQWHLENDGTTTGALKGEDIGVVSIWNQGCKGIGVNVVTVDDGMEFSHEDLSPNYDSSFGIDFSGLGGGAGFFNKEDCLSNKGIGCHGTAVSGIMAARDSNGLGVSGVAPRAKVGVRNVLFNPTDSNSSRAMSENATPVWVSNNSWGATDNTGNLIGPGNLWRSGVESGFSIGRNNLGSLFFWAGGNGGRFLASTSTALTAELASGQFLNVNYMKVGVAPTDNSNYDGQANHFRTIAVAASGNNGIRSSYSEEGANLLITAPSLGSTGAGIVTTDISTNGGYNKSTTSSDLSDKNYTDTFSGTSAASPVAAGVGALILEANNKLTARDVRVILARSAKQIDATDPDWITNGGELKFNHKYGFGRVDASKAVSLAKNWSNIGPEIVTANISGPTTSSTILNNTPAGITNIATVTGSRIEKVEFVEVTVSISTPATDDPGDLYIELVSPSNTKARLMVPRICPNNSYCNAVSAWTFGATIFMDERADGNWTLRIADVCNKSGDFTCTSSSLYPQSRIGANFSYSSSVTIGNQNHTLTSWSMRIRGRAN